MYTRQRTSLWITAGLLVTALFWGTGSGVWARANPAVTSFNNTVLKAYNQGIRDINKAHLKRLKEPHQKAAAQKYTARFERSFVTKVKSLRKSAKTALAEGLRTSSVTVVKNRIKTLNKHVSTLKKLKQQSSDLIGDMNRHKRMWWRHNKRYFSGTRMSLSKLKKLGFWVQVYGTPDRVYVVLDPATGVKRSYRGAIRKEQAQLNKLSAELNRILAAYRAALKKLQARKALLEAKLHKKTGKKKIAPAPPPQPDFVSDM